MNFRHLIRMSRWARNPPSETRVKLVFGVILACLALVAIERFIGWPDALTTKPIPRVKISQ
ncbi:hypothetical protein [Shimia marina]|uniref:Uncharacterized protein n=1 Tax=Shimia marina TaxID=321267 RepID=A0A0P1ESP4_9RHOB|nr:hypothetical protein [Shimia marina]CUH53544.1 hypothetical protein SHM7688_02998 [Shimia marina]SFD74649.1 hypothetical protein SAMN04488037_102272 [Shimia marina]